MGKSEYIFTIYHFTFAVKTFLPNFALVFPEQIAGDLGCHLPSRQLQVRAKSLSSISILFIPIFIHFLDF